MTELQFDSEYSGNPPQNYEKFFVPVIGAPMAEDLIRTAALREMRRVLVPGGRLILNMPGPVPRIFTILGESLARHVGAEAGGFVNAVFSLHDETEIQNFMRGADFRDVSVSAANVTLRLPAPEEFMWQYILSTPLAGAMTQADAGRRSALERDVVSGWQEFLKDDALILDVRSVTVTARK